MEQVTFARQVHSVWIESRTFGDLDYKKRKNWNSNNQAQRDSKFIVFKSGAMYVQPCKRY